MKPKHMSEISMGHEQQSVHGSEEDLLLQLANAQTQQPEQLHGRPCSWPREEQQEPPQQPVRTQPQGTILVARIRSAFAEKGGLEVQKQGTASNAAQIRRAYGAPPLSTAHRCASHSHVSPQSSCACTSQ